MKSFRMTENFWENFRVNSWDRDRPTVIRSPYGDPILSDDETLEALRSSRSATHAAELDLFRFYLGLKKIDSDFERWLPSETEKLLSKYLDRISEQASPEKFFFNLCATQNFFPIEIWQRFIQFLEGLHAVTGVPIDKVSGPLFFGNYSKTSFGVHKDQASVFSFVLGGKKKIRVWPYKTLPLTENYPGMFEYSEYLDRSILLEGDPGDIIFWPSSHWHIAEGDGEMNISLSLAIYPSTRS